jgi:hypothetical protein
MKRITGALCAIAMACLPNAAHAARTLTFTFFANGSGVWSGYNSDWTTFTRPVTGATISFSVLVGDGANGGGGGGPNGGFGVGANTTGIGFNSNGMGTSSYFGLTSSGQACFSNPDALLPFGRVAVDPGCGSVSFRQQYRYAFIEFSGAVDGLTITEGGVSGDAYVVPFVPEPATWALMLAGFGLTGYALRRRRFRPAPAI